MGIRNIINNHKINIRLERLAQHLGISMSLMADAYVKTFIVQGTYPAPAATIEVAEYGKKEGRTLYGRGGKKLDKERRRYHTFFDTAKMPTIERLDVWLGVAWHELGHTLWSDFSGDVTQGLNLLEDARIETLLIQNYPRTRGALMGMLRWMLGQVDMSDPLFTYAWAAGRTHLSKEIRSRLRKPCDPGKADQVDRIFKDYLSMGNQYDSTLARRLGQELDALLGIKPTQIGSCHTTMNKQAGGKGQYDESSVVSQATIDDIGGDEGDSGSESDDSSAEPSDTGAGTASEADESGSDDTGKEAGGGNPEHYRNVRKLKEELAKEAGSDAALQQEVAKLSKYIEGGILPQTSQSGTKVMAPNAEAAAMSREIRRIAGRFNDDSGKGIVRKLDHGRIRPIRYERTGDMDTAYDAWEPGLSQEMHIVLAIDVSGSMRDAPVSEIVYALEVGLEDVATVEVILWSDSFYVPSVSNSPTRMVDIPAHGSTDPTDALAYAHQNLLRNSAANRLLVFYTDGQFNGTEYNLEGKIHSKNCYQIVEAYVQDLMRQGVSVRMLDEKGKGRLEYKMRALPSGITQRVDGITDLPKIVEDWTRSILTTM